MIKIKNWLALLRIAAAFILILAAMPLVAGGTATASQNGDDHKVTLCHRTNAENNPYVKITIDKAAVFKRGHDTHNEGVAYVQGDKSRDVRWGDIIPTFKYFASPQDNTEKTYPGLNNTPEGLEILKSGCEVPGTPSEPEPSGVIFGECVETSNTFVVSGTLDDDDVDGSADVTFRLKPSPGDEIVLSDEDLSDEAFTFSAEVTAAPGTTVHLQFRIGDGAWTNTDETVTVTSCTGQGTVDKTSSPASGSTVPAGSTINYAVTVTNTGTETLTDKPVVDTLPSFVTVSGTPSDLGVVSGNGGKITWKVTLTPSESKTLTYNGLVSASAPAASVLLNTVRFLGIEDTTTHTVGSRGLGVTKSVSQTGNAKFGDTLTYTLTVSSTGTLPQTAVVVTDRIPADTTYVAGSAACVGTACTPTLTGDVLSWPLGSMEPNTSRSVNFKVTINMPTPAVAATGVTIRNSGAVQSAEVPSTPSNEVVTPVPPVTPAATPVAPAATPVAPAAPVAPVAVEGTKTGTDDSASPDAADTADSDVLGTKTGGGDVLAATGAGLPLSVTLGLGGLLLLAGIALVSVGRPVAGRTKD